MSVAPTVSSKKGEVILQPAYFTSSIFVEALREDILGLIAAFTEAYSQTAQPSQPFTLFKTIWTAQGWPWYHLRVLDDRSRDKFLQVVARLFVGTVTCILFSVAADFNRWSRKELCV